MIQLNNMVEKMRLLIFRVLVFFRIVDPFDLNLSITNIAIIIALYKLYTAPATSLVDIGALIVGMLNFGWKKYLNQDIAQASIITNKIIKKSEDVISSS